MLGTNHCCMYVQNLFSYTMPYENREKNQIFCLCNIIILLRLLKMIFAGLTTSFYYYRAFNSCACNVTPFFTHILFRSISDWVTVPVFLNYNTWLLDELRPSLHPFFRHRLQKQHYNRHRLINMIFIQPTGFLVIWSIYIRYNMQLAQERRYTVIIFF